VFSTRSFVPLQGVGLCHGISGNAYALLSHSNATGEALWRRRAVQFGLFAAHHWQHLYGVPDAAASLYEVWLIFSSIRPCSRKGPSPFEPLQWRAVMLIIASTTGSTCTGCSMPWLPFMTCACCPVCHIIIEWAVPCPLPPTTDSTCTGFLILRRPCTRNCTVHRTPACTMAGPCK